MGSNSALSNGEFIQNPRFYENCQKELGRAQRRVAGRKQGSHRRKKAVVLLRKLHERIHNKRLDWTHKTALALVQKYGIMVLENLKVKGLCQGIVSKQVHDAGWSQFLSVLKSKAESAARRVVEVDCRYTSQECPVCGNKKKKLLSERKHECSECRYTTHRDTAAGQIILGRMCPLDANAGERIPCIV